MIPFILFVVCPILLICGVLYLYGKYQDILYQLRGREDWGEEDEWEVGNIEGEEKE